MNRYEISIPRVACGIAAVVMMAITVAVSVVVPATMGDSPEDPVLDRTTTTNSESTVDIVAVPHARSNPDAVAEGAL